MGLSLSRTTHCRLPEDDEECVDCGWKCNCMTCYTQGDPHEHNDCHCTCRFWIVICGLICIGFCLLLFSALFHRRTVLSLLSAGAVFYSGSLLALTVVAEHCVWAAFFSITMVFAFPCFYSCCWSQQSQTADDLRGRSTSMTRSPTEAISHPPNKPTSAVVMLFPDGDMQLGVRETEMQATSDGNDHPTTSTTQSADGRSSLQGTTVPATERERV